MAQSDAPSPSQERGGPTSRTDRLTVPTMAAERRHRIKEILLAQASVRVSELVALFGVSSETIRRDLRHLASEGLVQREYGGAVVPDTVRTAMAALAPVKQRRLRFREEKDAIGRGAAGLVGERETVILDAGSTAWNVARHLKRRKGLTIVTNSIDVVQECSDNSDIEILVVGGKLIPRSMGLVGPQATLELHRYNADVAFLGITGVSLENGFSCTDVFEAETKQAMASAARKVVVVADHSKLQSQDLVCFVRFDKVAVLVTTDLADPTILRRIEAQGVRVLVCPVSP